MARKRQKGRTRDRATRAPIPDEELIARLQKKAPEVLMATVPEAAFDSVVQRLLEESPGLTTNPHFYCRPCGEYHEKKHPHHAETKARAAERKRQKRA